MEDVSCGGDETFVAVSRVSRVWCVVCGVSPGGAQGLCQLACAGQGFSFDNGGEPQVTSASDGLDGRRRIF